MEVANVATPPASVPVPSVVAPSLNVTVPLGVPEAADITVAVNVTEPPKALGLCDDFTLALVPPLFTFCVRPDEVDPVKLASPP